MAIIRFLVSMFPLKKATEYELLFNFLLNYSQMVVKKMYAIPKKNFSISPMKLPLP